MPICHSFGVNHPNCESNENLGRGLRVRQSETRMVAPWQETQLRVVIEFKKASRKGVARRRRSRQANHALPKKHPQDSSGMKRKITLTHNGKAMAPQLQGRIDPNAWAALLADCEQLGLEHPYCAAPTAGCCLENCMACIMVRRAVESAISSITR